MHDRQTEQKKSKNILPRLVHYKNNDNNNNNNNEREQILTVQGGARVINHIVRRLYVYPLVCTQLSLKGTA